MIIVYGSHDIPIGHVDEAVEALMVDEGYVGKHVTRIMYDREYYVFNINNLPEDDMLTTAHYLYHHTQTVDHSPEGEVAGNCMTACVNTAHRVKQIECHCGLEDCRVADIGCYHRTLANGVEVKAYYIS